MVGARGRRAGSGIAVSRVYIIGKLSAGRLYSYSVADHHARSPRPGSQQQPRPQKAHMSSTHVAVFMGGRSSEHEISLKSGGGVARALEGAGFKVTPVLIGRDGQWSVEGSAPARAAIGLAQLEGRGVDCAFIALHGPYGEDGRIQGLFDMTGLPYTGSGCAASALAMDKVRSKAVVAAQGIRVAGHLALDRPTWAIDSAQVVEAIEKDIGFPCVIKAVSQGSSKGVAICDSLLTLRRDMESVMEVEDNIFVEQFVKGVEVTCSVLDADPSGRIRPPAHGNPPENGAPLRLRGQYTGATEEITRAHPCRTNRPRHGHGRPRPRGHRVQRLEPSDFYHRRARPRVDRGQHHPWMTETSLFPRPPPPPASTTPSSSPRSWKTRCRARRCGRLRCRVGEMRKAMRAAGIGVVEVGAAP